MKIWNPKNKNYLFYLIALVWVFMVLPYIINMSYITAMYMIIVSRISILGLAYLLTKHALTQNGYFKYLLIGFSALLIGYSGSSIFLLVNTNHSDKPLIMDIVKADKLESDVVYITYSDKCPFCNIAKPDINRGILTYLLTHKGNKVKLVNIEDDNEITQQLRKDIDRKGSILKYNKEMRLIEMKTYIAMNQNYEPAAPGANHIYDLIKEIDNR